MTLRQTILAVASYYGRTISEQVLEMYAEDLADLEEAEAIRAYAQWRRDPKNKVMPLPAQIRELVCPELFISPEVQAREIASRIVGAVTGCGWNNGRAADLYIGPIGWEAVQRNGGWMHLCQNLGVNLDPGIFQAQIRDQIEGTIKYGGHNIARVIGIDSTKRSGELTSVADVFKKLTSSDALKDPGDAS